MAAGKSTRNLRLEQVKTETLALLQAVDTRSDEEMTVGYIGEVVARIMFNDDALYVNATNAAGMATCLTLEMNGYKGKDPALIPDELKTCARAAGEIACLYFESLRVPAAELVEART